MPDPMDELQDVGLCPRWVRELAENENGLALGKSCRGFRGVGFLRDLQLYKYSHMALATTKNKK